MPFPWQTTGALQGGVPNQMNSFTPQNNEGLGVPWNRAMFTLPRYQMPGSNINFGGGFGFGGREGSNQMGMASGVQPIGVNFSINRQASSDPVKNIINDIQNPLGGMTTNFTGSGGQQSPLKNRMVGGDVQQSEQWTPLAPDVGHSGIQAMRGTMDQNLGAWNAMQEDQLRNQPWGPWGGWGGGLRTRMTQITPNAIFY